MLRFFSGFIFIFIPAIAFAAEPVHDPAKAIVKATGEPLVPLLLLLLALTLAFRFWKKKALFSTHKILGFAVGVLVLVHAGLSFYKLGFVNPAVIAAGGLGAASIATLIYTGLTKASPLYHRFALAFLIFGFASHKVTMALVP